MSCDDAQKLLRSACAANVVYRGGKYVRDAVQEANIVKAAKFLTDKGGKFGMMFCGTCGNGKTTLARAIADAISFASTEGYFRKRVFRMAWKTAREVANLGKDDYKALDDLKRTPLLTIDELGTEPVEVMSFGNVTNPVIDLLDFRYNYQLFTIVTTNLMASEIRGKYHDRMADRFNEMFSVLVFGDETFRK